MSYLSDKEQVQLLKDFWNKFGTWILVVICVISVSYSGYQYWEKNKIKHKEQAMVLFQHSVMATDEDPMSNIFPFVLALKKDYADTVYASLAVMMVARQLVDLGKPVDATLMLQWVIDNGQSETIHVMAKIRLARLLLSTKKYSQAAKILDTIQLDSFMPLVHLLKSKVAWQLKQHTKAREQWRLAQSGLLEYNKTFPMWLEPPFVGDEK